MLPINTEFSTKRVKARQKLSMLDQDSFCQLISSALQETKKRGDFNCMAVTNRHFSDCDTSKLENSSSIESTADGFSGKHNRQLALFARDDLKQVTTK
jgi:hypothetical protein